MSLVQSLVSTRDYFVTLLFVYLFSDNSYHNVIK